MAANKRTLQKNETRERIIRIAMRLYRENGLETAVDTVAAEAGLSHGAIFVHFPTREALRRTVLERFTQEIGERLHGLAAGGSDLAAVLKGHLSILAEYERFYTELILLLPSLPEDTRNAVISMQSILSRHISLPIGRAQEAGQMRKLPIHLLFNTWLGLVHYYLMNADLFAPGESVLSRYQDELVSHFLALIST